MLLYKILILVMLIELIYTQIPYYPSSLNNIGGFNSTCDIKYKCKNPTLICVNNKCLCRDGFK
jgi:hypothetical protein